MSKILDPVEVYQELFFDIHKAAIIDDDKAIADARARIHPDVILKAYRKEKAAPDFDLKTFVEEYFEVPTSAIPMENTVERLPINDHLDKIWGALKRQPSNGKYRSTLLPLPYSYIVPGGRFNEIYYWDSYFTMLGLKEAGDLESIEEMIKNFCHFLQEYGHIPNGNRSYFLSRSQPPFFSLMVKLLIKATTQYKIKDYLPCLVREYNFWMKGTETLKEDGEYLRVIKRGSYLLNRYYDAKDTPREEMYGHDLSLINFSNEVHNPLFRHIRAACESGWDFSSRWFRDPADFTSIHTTEIIPVDLNCLLWHLEQLISECYNAMGKDELALNYGILAVNRKKAIQEIFWNEETQYFHDYDMSIDRHTSVKSLAGMYPLYFGLCSQDQADHCADMIKSEFLQDGGLVSTTLTTGLQWDAPNGWAPLHWIAIRGLMRNGHRDLAQEIAHRWIKLNQDVYQRTGKMLEKYNVVDITLEGGGGEYPVQDGFGWTNGVYTALTHL